MKILPQFRVLLSNFGYTVKQAAEIFEHVSAYLETCVKQDLYLQGIGRFTRHLNKLGVTVFYMEPATGIRSVINGGKVEPIADEGLVKHLMANGFNLVASTAISNYFYIACILTLREDKYIEIRKIVKIVYTPAKAFGVSIRC